MGRQMSHPVLELIRRRIAEGSRPGDRDPSDHARLALAIEGGGMRGSITGGMALAIDKLGLLTAPLPTSDPRSPMGRP